MKITKKAALALVLLALLLPATLAGAAITPGETRRYGGTGFDVLLDAAALPDSGMLLAGYTTSDDGDMQGRPTASDTHVDAALLRIGADGSVLWTYLLGEEDRHDSFVATFALPDGRVALIHNATGVGSELLLLDADGAPLASHPLNMTVYYAALDGDTLVLSGTDLPVAADGEETFVAAGYALDGARLWHARLDAHRDETYMDIAVSQDGYLLAGWFDDGDSAGLQPLVTKIDKSGEIAWTHVGRSAFLGQVRVACGVAALPGGGAIAVGQQNPKGITSGNEGFVLLLGADGNETSCHDITRSDDGSFLDITPLPDGRFLALGYIPVEYASGEYAIGDAWLSLLGADGAFIDEGYVPATFTAGGQPRDILRMPDGTVYLYGTTPDDASFGLVEIALP